MHQFVINQPVRSCCGHAAPAVNFQDEDLDVAPPAWDWKAIAEENNRRAYRPAPERPSAPAPVMNLTDDDADLLAAPPQWDWKAIAAENNKRR